MSSTLNQLATANSFLGLQSYTEAQSNFFFGRDAETDTLTSLVQLNMLTIVFGRSGTGKTSLLNAGVFPRLRKSFCLPFRIRLEFTDNSPDLLTQVKNILKEEIDKYGFKVESYPASETLWEYFHKEPLWKTVTPILVFDQFEEIFTIAKSNLRFAATELPLFWEDLSDLIENNIPEKLKEKFLDQKDEVGYNYKKQKAKIVFSFREEYLPEFESIAAKIPSLKYSRFRLLPMNGNQAYEVITRTWKDNISEKEARQLVSYFTNEPGTSDYSLVTVEPSLLSQVCAYLDKQRMDSGGGKFSAELLIKYPKDTILRTIYEETVNASNSSLNIADQNKYNPIREFIEEKLITIQGYRTKYNLGAQDELLKPGLNILTARYLIREDDNVVELTHDVLTPIIKTDREKRRKEIAQARTRKKAIRIAALIIFLALAGGAILAIAGYLKKRDMEAQREEAKIERDAARTERDKTNIELNVLKKEIVRKQKELNAIINDPAFNRQPETDKTVQQLLDEINQLSEAFAELGIKSENDIAAIALKLRKANDVVTPPVTSPVSQQDSEKESLQKLLNEKDRRYDSLLRAHQLFIKQFDDLKKDYNRLDSLYKDLLKKYYDPARPGDSTYTKPIINPSKNNFDTTNSLKLNLYYGKKYNTQRNPPSNLTIYLIPYEINAKQCQYY
jgi:hypothetical protein